MSKFGSYYDIFKYIKPRLDWEICITAISELKIHVLLDNIFTLLKLYSFPLGWFKFWKERLISPPPPTNPGYSPYQLQGEGNSWWWSQGLKKLENLYFIYFSQSPVHKHKQILTDVSMGVVHWSNHPCWHNKWADIISYYLSVLYWHKSLYLNNIM